MYLKKNQFLSLFIPILDNPSFWPIYTHLFENHLTFIFILNLHYSFKKQNPKTLSSHHQPLHFFFPSLCLSPYLRNNTYPNQRPSHRQQ